ncbi:MAG: matrixin family metalloprotease [Deltaproteobacteria bacterium]|nr:matrixin family metalloprotease [Deltaproteobacteria bacterium]
MRALVAAIASLLTCSTANAFNCTLSDSNPLVSVHWENRTITYAVEDPGPDGLDSVAAADTIREAFLAWTGAECSDVRFEMAAVVDENAEDQNRVIFLKDAWPHGPEAVALTTVAHRSKDGLIQRARIEVNEATFDFTLDVDSCDGEVYDLGAVLTHEVGHFLGLAHTQPELVFGEDTDPTMTAVVDPCDGAFRTLERDDVEGLCFLYPIGGAARTCATLPIQAEPYVQNGAFGCACGRSGRGRGLSALMLSGLILLSRRRSPPAACPPDTCAR